MTDKKWTPDPKLGGEQVEARRAEVVEHLKTAVNAAHYHIDQQLELDIQALKKRAGEQKNKMVAAVTKAETLPAMTTVRKYWAQTEDEIMHGLVETIMRNT